MFKIQPRESMHQNPCKNIFLTVFWFKDMIWPVSEKYCAESEEVAGGVNKTVVTISILDTPDVFTSSKVKFIWFFQHDINMELSHY